MSFTTDMWTSPTQVAFLVVTAHYVVCSLVVPELQARLVGFRKVSGVHSGINMAHHLAQIIHELCVEVFPDFLWSFLLHSGHFHSHILPSNTSGYSESIPHFSFYFRLFRLVAGGDKPCWFAHYQLPPGM